MASDGPFEYRSEELRIAPTLGRVSNGSGASVRLGPINMKVLMALVSRPGLVVTRNELFEGVWRNQVVSDDALTRCVSDIRAELRKLSGREDWIETVPKRGYRWVGEVLAADVAGPSAEPQASDAAPEGGAGVEAARARFTSSKVVRVAARGAAYLAALVVMASLAVSALDIVSDPRAPVVALLPTVAEPVHADIAAALDLELGAQLMADERIRVLARSAIDSRPSNPFPFFYYEFGARWLVESELRWVAGSPVLTIAVVDARTGIVEMQSSARIAEGSGGNAALPRGALDGVQAFIESQLDR